MNVDLHTHSTVSDGALAPAALVRRAAAQGVDLLALTDHDQLGGLEEARETAHEEGLAFVDGVEVSVTWRGATLHVIGLRVDTHDPQLDGALRQLRGGRMERARRIAQSLADAGVQDGAAAILRGALAHAEDPSMVGRTHFARHLAAIGVVSDSKAAFRRFLTPGKPGFVPYQWALLQDAVRWIRDAGGQAVIAHPGRYGLSPGAMDELLLVFRGAGGAAIEAVTGSHSPDQYQLYGALAAQHGLALSRGSDFHGPGEGAELGSLPTPALPARELWQGWPR